MTATHDDRKWQHVKIAFRAMPWRHRLTLLWGGTLHLLVRRKGDGIEIRGVKVA
jgi:hypothetical protein